MLYKTYDLIQKWHIFCKILPYLRYGHQHIQVQVPIYFTPLDVYYLSVGDKIVEGDFLTTRWAAQKVYQYRYKCSESG